MRRTRGSAVGVALGAVTAGTVGALAWAAREMPAAFGGDPKAGERGQRMRDSPRYRDGVFHNVSEPESGAPRGPEGGARTILKEMLFGKQLRHPSRPIPVVRDAIPEAADAALSVTWFGHSTALVEIEGRRVLLDPVWSERCSPTQSVGPRRMHEPPVALDALPRIDAVVISHDHYDHLDMRSIRELARTQEARFVVPLGVGAHLERWGVERDRIDELDWEEETRIAGLRLVSTSAQHFSGRGLANNGTLWSSWAIIGAEHRVFYSGDSGYFDGFAETGRRHGPFDLSLIQIGAYSDHWRSVHMTPEEGVSTHLDVTGLNGRDPEGHAGLMVPVHWGTFVLGLHDWSEPVERLCTDADERGVRVAVPRPGERVEVARPPKLDHWWRAVV
ncbi:L-ascorbate metabolism protein UlaG (beta-lactamase superfamily) [Streptacidiphilus sp. MAP12-16]|uniref:MBL fold metallo-hydrolase n=1 Tax=Streptacidiphilus sp. MAP12-16 TaxID=3156300 RepID=UPI0035130CEF